MALLKYVSRGFIGLVLSLGLFIVAVADAPNSASLNQARDGKLYVVPAKGVPYCVHGCDVAEDCQSNEKNPLHQPNQDQKWYCENKPGFCVGTCVIVPKQFEKSSH